MSFGSPIFRKFVSGALFSIAVTLVLLALLIGRTSLLAAFLCAAALGLVVGFAVAQSFTLRVRRLQSFAESLLDARTTQVPLREHGDELGRLAAALNQLAQKLRQLSSGLGEEAARRESILSGMQEGLLAVDERLNVIFCNDSLARLLGVSAAAARLMPAEYLLRDRPLGEMLRRALISGESSRQTLQLTAIPGRTFEALVSPLSAVSRSGAIAIFHDITDLERLERVRRDFVANVSHELRTPLTAIRGYAETLLEGALDDPRNNRRFLEIIQANAVRLTSIASDLLTLAELEHEPPVELGPVPIRAVIENALRTLEAEARMRGLKLRLDELPDAEVMGEKVRLEQAFVNLVSNAVKFNRPGGEVHVSARRDGNSLRITVRDTGIGIAPEHLSRIFERFYRVDKARSRDLGGTGLGLSIVRHVVERVGGSIAVESRLGEGSAFTVTLPLP
jgi:two-component system phosphate regulon sensor histidine kinase PhoR